MASETITDSASNELYVSLSPEIRDRLREQEETRIIAQGEKLIKRNTLPTHLICIKSGTVEISVPRRNASIRIAVVGTGKVLGLRSLLSDELPETEATCLEDCVAGLIPKKIFIDLLKEFPQIYLAVAKVLSADLQTAHRHLRKDRCR